MQINGTKSDLALDAIEIEDGECKPNAVLAECKSFNGDDKSCEYVNEKCGEECKNSFFIFKTVLAVSLMSFACKLAVLDRARRAWKMHSKLLFSSRAHWNRTSVFLALVFFYSEETPNSRGVLYLKQPSFATWHAVCRVFFYIYIYDDIWKVFKCKLKTAWNAGLQRKFLKKGQALLVSFPMTYVQNKAIQRVKERIFSYLSTVIHVFS